MQYKYYTCIIFYYCGFSKLLFDTSFVSSQMPPKSIIEERFLRREMRVLLVSTCNQRVPPITVDVCNKCQAHTSTGKYSSGNPSKWCWMKCKVHHSSAITTKINSRESLTLTINEWHNFAKRKFGILKPSDFLDADLYAASDRTESIARWSWHSLTLSIEFGGSCRVPTKTNLANSLGCSSIKNNNENYRKTIMSPPILILEGSTAELLNSDIQITLFLVLQNFTLVLVGACSRTLTRPDYPIHECNIHGCIACWQYLLLASIMLPLHLNSMK